MSLRRKTLIIVLVTLAFLVGFLLAMSQFLLFKSYESLEQQKTRLTVEQAVTAFDDQIQNLKRGLNDWSRWDDSHQYALDGNEAYKTSNLHVNTFETLRLTDFIFLDPQGKSLYAQGYDIEKAELALTFNLAETLRPNDPLVRTQDVENQGSSGILMLPDGPRLVAARPILKSDGSGPVAGTMIWARKFDAAELARLTEKTRLKIQVEPVGPNQSPDFAQALAQIKAGEEKPVIPQDELNISGYALIQDLYGQPGLLIRVDQVRDVRAQGKKTLTYFLGALIACSLIFGLVVLWLINKQVLSRLFGLLEGIQAVDKLQDLSLRMPVSGKDEITHLSNSVNSMLIHLEETQAALEGRNRDTAEILGNVGQGLVTFGPDLVVNNEYSAICVEIFGVKPAGKNFSRLLFTDFKKQQDFVEWAAIVFDNDRKVPTFTILEMAESEVVLRTAESTKTLSLEYRPIFDPQAPDQVKKIMAVITDISHQKAVETRAAKEREEHEQIVKILRDQDTFFSFLYNARKILADSREMLTTLETQPNSALSALFRGMHTIKGTAAAFSIKSVSSRSHEIENLFAALQKGERKLSPELLGQLQTEIGRLFEELEEVVRKVGDLLGEPFGVGSKVFKIREDKLWMFAKTVDQLTLDQETTAKLQQEIKKLCRIPAGRAFRMYANNLESLAERTGKELNPLVIVNGDLDLDVELIKALDAPLMHLLRNAVDHGVEDPADREMMGKPSAGTISLGFAEEAGNLVVTLSDDGNGIDPEVIRPIAVKRGMFTEEAVAKLSDLEVIHLIFQPSFSTKSEATDISGRGVGMDVVKTDVEGLGGKVEIQSEVGVGTKFILRLPLSS